MRKRTTAARRQPSSKQPAEVDAELDEMANAPASDGVDYAGTKLTVTWGREHFSPVQYNGYDIGPFTMEVTVQRGETPLQAERRAMVHMEAMASEEKTLKLKGFLARLSEAGEGARNY